MEKIRFILFAAVGMVFAACSSDDLQGSTDRQILPPDVTESPILFSSVKSSTTRADATGADAAELLDKKFVVFGYKGSATSGYDASNKVFDNYLVVYEPNTENTTDSNTKNWEYVGKGPIAHASNNGISSQKVKYWDYSQSQYDFMAWSTGKKEAVYSGTPGTGQVYVSAISPVPAASPGKALTSAYTMTGSMADLTACYISDLVTRKKSGSAGTGTVVGYSDDPVTFKFRQLGTKVRIAIYETVPGYSVKNIKFYSASTGDLLNESDATYGAQNATENATAKLFTSSTSGIPTDGTFMVHFPIVDTPDNADNNQAHVTYQSGTTSSTVDWGALNYTYREEGEKSTSNVYLGRSSNTATFAGDATKNYYTLYMPNESGSNLNLRVNYTLESTDGSGEVINVKGATAQVPSIYTQWKAGYAYTYIFKISDKTNGHTGDYDPTNPGSYTDPVGLYPITFDAMVENSEDNDVTQETITLVSTPSITTYQQASDVVNNNEYTVGNDIFVTVNENDNLVSLNDKATLYTLPAVKTEAEVIDALQIRADGATGTVKGRNGLVLTSVTKETSATATDLTGKYKLTDAVEYGADGNAISVGTDKALRFKPAAATTYAFVYTQSASTSETPSYVRLEKSAGDDVTGLYRFKYSQASGDANTYTQYYSKASGDYTPVTTVYYGQSLSGYYGRTGEGTTESPYIYNSCAGGSTSSTGGIYYYTEDGTTYKPVTNIAFADFAGATDLYTYNGASYTQKQTTVKVPVDGVKYYQKTTTGGVDTYTLCVILPQQANSWYVIHTWEYEKVTESTAVAWQSYFDRYAQNNGVYYTKVIKVQ